MGRMLGAFDESSSNYDRPDLNKCPDCGCFFEGEYCPLCGKECPPEFRAGQRKPEKKKREKRVKGAVFVEWYHKWWFIILMMFVFPIVGLILLITSPHDTSKKVIFIVVLVILFLLSTFGLAFLGMMLGKYEETSPVNTSIPKEEYIAECVKVDPEEFYRNYGDYKDKYVTMTLTVKEKIKDTSGYYGDDEGISVNTYYLCTNGKGDSFIIMIRDCTGVGKNYIKGDVITVYGEGRGEVSVDDEGYNTHSYPCIYVAYIK